MKVLSRRKGDCTIVVQNGFTVGPITYRYDAQRVPINIVVVCQQV